jgi:hypothetical protein
MKKSAPPILIAGSSDYMRSREYTGEVGERLAQEDASIIHQNIHSSEVVDCGFDRLAASLLLPDVAIEQNKTV